MPNGVPRYVRIWDNGGESFDRYTVIYGKKSMNEPGQRRAFFGRAMSHNPTEPQGFGLGIEFDDPRGGKHLGKRIRFDELPPDCQKLVLSDYADIWNLSDE